MKSSPDVLICGAGIAGISCAYYLAVKYNVHRVWIVDDLPPLSLTSDKSSECYRNWWPDPAMVCLMNSSIDHMEELAYQTGNSFHLNRRGYLYVTANQKQAKRWRHDALKISDYGGGPLRIYQGGMESTTYTPSNGEAFDKMLNGADLILDADLLKKHYPYLSTHALAALHTRRAGWFSSQQLGMLLLNQARAKGVQLVSARVTGIKKRGGRVESIELNNTQSVSVGAFVNAAGPFFPHLMQLLEGESLPVTNELHLKAVFNDSLNVVPRNAPLLIWSDPQILTWEEEERSLLYDEPDTAWMLAELPAGAHIRPEGSYGSQMILLLWEYRSKEMEPVWPIPLDPQYAEMTIRGLVSMLPGLKGYLKKLPRAVIDGGYYTRTPENRPLIGPLSVDRTYACGAFSGYGLMAACGAGDILAKWITQTSPPPDVNSFSPARYQDPVYLEKVKTWGNTGQL